MKIDDWLLDILACPKCHSPLRADEAASELVCTGADCGLAYPVRDDIPVLLIDEARDPALATRGSEGPSRAGDASGGSWPGRTASPAGPARPGQRARSPRPVTGASVRSSRHSARTWASRSPSSSPSSSPDRRRCWPSPCTRSPTPATRSCCSSAAPGLDGPRPRSTSSASAPSVTSTRSWWRSCCSLVARPSPCYEGIDRIRHPEKLTSPGRRVRRPRHRDRA